MNTYVVVLVLVVVAAWLILPQLRSTTAATRVGAYRRRKLMTDNEEEFFGRLVAAFPDHYVFPQVAMSALLDTAAADKRTAHGDRLRIAQQRADYVICTRRCEVVAVVELDDKTHRRAKDELRDARVAQAGIRTVRFQSRNKPTIEALRATVLGQAAAPAETGPDKAVPQDAPPAVGTRMAPRAST